MRLPKVIYVRVDDAGDGTNYFLAESDSDAFEEGVIGVYELKRKARVRTRREFRHDANGPWRDKP